MVIRGVGRILSRPDIEHITLAKAGVPVLQR
jgi:hypothetical protein